MVDVDKLKQLVVAMFKKGMTIDQIKTRLKTANLDATDDLIKASSVEAGVFPTENPKTDLSPSAEEKPKEAPKEAKRDDIPELTITSFSGGEEKSLDLANMLGKEDKGPAEAEALFEKSSQASVVKLGEVEKKLDELGYRIRALEEVNKQILSTLKETLYRIK